MRTCWQWHFKNYAGFVLEQPVLHLCAIALEFKVKFCFRIKLLIKLYTTAPFICVCQCRTVVCLPIKKFCVEYFSPMPTMMHAVYFWFSFVYLIIRTLAVTMYSAEINDQSKEPYKVIRSVPREAWCLEIKRFSNEVSRDIVALSGMKFFFLTRGMVLSVSLVRRCLRIWFVRKFGKF